MAAIDNLNCHHGALSRRYDTVTYIIFNILRVHEAGDRQALAQTVC